MKILIVEDNPDHAEIARLALEPQFEVDWVASGEGVWQYLEELTPDDCPAVILLDYSLPEIDGLCLLARIKKEKNDIPVIMVTGQGDQKVAVEAMKRGAYDYVVKEGNYIENLAPILFKTIKQHEMAMEKAKLERELEKLTIIDDLTGLFNRRYFYRKLEEEITRANRQKGNLVLIMFDLDCFKEYNDNFGHLAGDQALKEVAGIITRSIREMVDSACRYGGDEFTILLPGADKGHASIVAERIRKTIREKKIGALDISAGIAEFDHEVGVEDFIRSADKEMYIEKKSRKEKAII
ncbi:MAG: diguanylate cyclase [Syntrophales bacterium]|nr:diguanylate cyclase [Syntrophales bacterium]